ncbi:MAG: ABC transporter substrate-binding protein [Brachybacterium sp.]
MSRMPRSLSRRSLLGAGGTLSLLALAACGGSGGGGRSGQTFDQVDGDTPEEYAERQRVVMWNPWGGKSGEELVRQQQLFNESQEEFYVEVQTFDGYDGVDTRIATALQARAIPDLAGFGETTWHRLFLNEVLEPLDAHFDDEWNAETYQPALLEEGRYNDQVFWLPQGRSTPLFYYNKEVFEQAGLPDRAPETWSEFREWGNQIKGTDYRGEKISMRAYSVSDDWYIQGLSWNFGGGYSDENLNLTMSEQGMLDALAFDRAVIHEDKSSYVASDMVVDFKAGLVATVCTSTGSLGGIVEEADFEFGAGFLPREVEAGVPTGGGGISLMKNASEESKAGAIAFLKFLASPENSAAWTLASGYLPNTIAAAESEEFTARVEETPAFGVALEQLEIARQSDSVRLNIPATVPEMRTVIQRVNTNNEDPAAVIGEAETAIAEAKAAVQETFDRVMGN